MFKKDAAEVVADHFEEARKVADTKMYVTYTGRYKGVEVTAVSTGSGSPELELAFTEFASLNKADTFIRIGCSGALQEHVRVGDLVISSGAVRDEGTSGEYILKAYPAVAHYEVLLALIEAAERLQSKYHVGITRSNDSFWVGQGRTSRNYIQREHENIIEYWKRAGVLNIEREVSALLTLTSLLGLRGGAICSVVNNRITGELGVGAGVENAIEVSLEAIKILQGWDAAKNTTGKKYFYPTLAKLSTTQSKPI